MRHNRLKQTCLLMAAILLSSLLSHSYAQSSSLKVIPEVRTFTAANGTLTLPKSINIAVETAHKDSLMPMATQLSAELKELGIAATQSLTTSITAKPNEIVLAYSKVALPNKEAYNMSIKDGVVIEGASRVGAFWGTRTLLQLITNYNSIIPKGEIKDHPGYPSRGFMIDVGRKFFTIDFLRHYVKFMAYYKMNEFHIHLNDNGFKNDFGNDWEKTYSAYRLESTTYPGLAAADGHYTKEEFRNLQILGNEYGVNVIPEIDIPAHSLAFTKYRRELMASAPYAPDHLAILDNNKLPMIYDFFDKLLDEYIDGENPTFINKDIHIGTDEFAKEGNIRSVDNAQAKRFREFTQHYISYIAAKGKRPRTWGGLRWLKDNPETKVTPEGGAIMNAWSYDWVDPVEVMNSGFKVISTPDTWLYIVPKAGYYHDFLDTQWIYNSYTPRMINFRESVQEYKPGLLGAMFAIWNDKVGNGISQMDAHYRIFPAMKVVATKTWSVTPTRTFEQYNELAQKMGEGPGLNMIGIYPQETLNALSKIVGEKAQSLNGTQTIELGAGDLGYNYDVSFDIKPAYNAENAILFQSKYAKVIMNTNNTGKLGFQRDGYTNSFNYKPISDKWQTVRIAGNYQNVKLYVDGKYIETLSEYRKNSYMYQQTLSFPITTIGDKTAGYKGEIRNLKLEIFDSQKAEKEFKLTKTTIENGEYYIIHNGQYLTNLNKGAKGGAPIFRRRIPTKTSLLQKWIFTYDESQDRYKIESAADHRYINELTVFGTNDYYNSWNTYTLYKKNNLYAIQNGGDAKYDFWKVNGTQLAKGTADYDEANYTFQIVKVQNTDVQNIESLQATITKLKNRLIVNSTNSYHLKLFSANGTLVADSQTPNAISFPSEQAKGVYILQLTNNNGVVATEKVVLD